MKTQTVLLVAGLALLAFVIWKKMGADAGPKKFGSTDTAVGPLFFGLGGNQERLLTARPAPGAPAWASVAATGINALGDLARRIWRPNSSVPSTGGGRADSPRDPIPQQATTYATASTSADLNYAVRNALPPDFEEDDF